MAQQSEEDAAARFQRPDNRKGMLLECPLMF
jgi:hypothetical protein